VAGARSSLSNRAPRNLKSGKTELDWNTILVRAAEIVKSYDTGVTLRQLYYRLVTEGLFPNRQQSYKTLSMKTAQARREGWFPSLIDRTREIEQYRTFESPSHALSWLNKIYLRDRTEGQPWSIYLGVEKHGLTTQLMSWFAPLGIPIMALGGYSSQTFVDEVAKHVHDQGRQSVLLYAGDFDPTGMDIDRDFEERTNIFTEVVRVALTPDIVQEYNLPPLPGKSTDSRSTAFMMEHGDLVQVELDALRPEDLRKLYQEAIDGYWNESAYKKAIAREKKENKLLGGLAAQVTMTTHAQASTLLDAVEDPDELRDIHATLTERIEQLDEDE
jgi:hypothetical protein